jgi:predicted phage terminase large subunit-like protein
MLDKVNAEESLRSFIELTWDRLEPARPFVTGWAVDAICEHLEAVTSGQLTRLLINVPPGCMKSLTTDVFWPAWEWGPRNMPSTRYVCASYSEALTIRDNRRCRNLITGEKYQGLWGDNFRLMADQNAKVKFENEHTGFKLATSVSGLGTGERGDRFIVDDAHNVKESESDVKRESVLQWFTEVVPTRINDSEKSAIIVIMQRVHEADVSGLILANELDYEWLCLPMEYEKRHRCFTSVPDNLGTQPQTVGRVQLADESLPIWVTPEEFPSLDVPAEFEPEWAPLYPRDPRTEEGELLWPERFSERYLEEELKPMFRSWGGTYAEAGQLQQRPAPRGGGDFKAEHFQILETAPSGGRWVRGWDLAGTKKKKSAYTVGTLFCVTPEGKVVCCDVVRFKGTPTEVEDRVLAVAEQDGRSVPISMPQDPGQAGVAQKTAYVRKLQGFNVNFTPETGEKDDRIKPLAAQAGGMNFYIVRGQWNAAYRHELMMGKKSMFKDQIDASSRSYTYLNQKREQVIGLGPELIDLGLGVDF